MSEIEFKNTRFDPSITPFLDLAKTMAAAFGYTADLAIEKPLAQLLRLRVAQANDCAYCVILHTRTAREIGVDEAKLDSLAAWYNSGLFDAKEQAALDYCDVLTEGKSKSFQVYHDKLAQHFDEREIAEIAAIVINMNLWTRLKLAQGETPFFVNQ